VFSPAVIFVLVPALAGVAALVAFLIYVSIRYSPIVARIFEETPMLLPLRAQPLVGDDVSFSTADGIRLAGTYLPAQTEARAGVIVFCHEFLSDRLSAGPYCDGLREMGFDLFTFDFRNHGDSAQEAGHQPLLWVSDRDLTDLRAALDYLRSRPDADPAGFGLVGVSRGGGAALCVAAEDPGIWGVVTDGAFPTKGTMLAYILRWAEIYVGSRTIWRRMPLWIFAFVGWISRLRLQWRLGRRFPDLERAVAQLAPRPWMAIHGEKDAYIGPEIASALFARAGQPKELWIVAGAKHNRCREIEPAAYRHRLEEFFRNYAPRRPLARSEQTEPSPAIEVTRATPKRGPVSMALVKPASGIVTHLTD
jgi:alpha-beta hydrolase superfamily lysophospholipase